MASTFADAVNALVAERDRQFVARIAADYNLDLAELMKKYTETAETVTKVPRKYKKRDPTAVTVVGETVKPAKGEKVPCSACTAKKEPCKFSALKGTVFCKRHTERPQAEKAAPAHKVPKASKPPQPVHTHSLDVGNMAECDLCQSHGNPLVETSDFEMVPSQVDTHLAEIIDQADEEEYEDEDF